MNTLIPKYKIADCDRCGANNTQCRKRGREYICLTCCRKEDVSKQLKKQKEKTKVRSLHTVDWKSNIEEMDEKVKKEQWFRMIREKLTGTCQCGCGNKSQKKDDMYFRHSCCHLFPKNRFQTVKYHPLNFVERAFFGGCHSILDDTSIERWPNMADWEDIKAKFYILAPLLTEEEKANKFYTLFEKLVNTN